MQMPEVIPVSARRPLLPVSSERLGGGTGVNCQHIAKCLVWFEDADAEPDPQLLVPVNWSQVRRFSVSHGRIRPRPRLSSVKRYTSQKPAPGCEPIRNCGARRAGSEGGRRIILRSSAESVLRRGLWEASRT